MQRQGEHRTWQAIDRLFRFTIQNTQLDSDRLLRQLGLNQSNLDRDHLQAIFGVMRTINTLHPLGFVNIHPLVRQKDRREADLVAERAGARFAIEVFRSSEIAYRYPNHKDRARNLQEYIADRYRVKRKQLAATIEAHRCAKALLAVVIDSYPAKALVQGEGFLAVARDSYRMIRSPPSTHLLIFTGMADVHGKDERAIYPGLPTNGESAQSKARAAALAMR